MGKYKKWKFRSLLLADCFYYSKIKQKSSRLFRIMSNNRSIEEILLFTEALHAFGDSQLTIRGVMVIVIQSSLQSSSPLLSLLVSSLTPLLFAPIVFSSLSKNASTYESRY